MPAKIEIKETDLTKLLMEPDDVLVLNIYDYIDKWKTDKKLLNELNEVKGIYIKNSPKPLIPFNDTCWVKEDNKYSPVRDLSTILNTNSDIYKGTSQVSELYILHSTVVKHQHKLTVEPYVNYVHIKFMQAVIDAWIGQMVNYIYSIDDKNFRECLKDFTHMYDVSEKYMETLSDLYDDICGFIDRCRWNLYFTRIVGNNIMVERYCDYRIYEWTSDQVSDIDA